jgi:hypothetical protein
MQNNYNHTLPQQFQDKPSFTRKELLDFFRNSEPDITEQTLAWRIYDLKKRGIIRSVKRGVYTSRPKPVFTPHLSGQLVRLAEEVLRQFPEIEFCIWETLWVNDLSRHQARLNIRIIEIEKEFVESLYHHLNDHLKFDIFVNPDEKEITLYVSESDNPVIIKQLITRSPIDTKTDHDVQIPIPSLEKILVDLYAETTLFYHYQGSELGTIFERALESYTLNFTKLFSYAGRRGKKDEIRNYIKRHAHHLEVKNILDD